MRRAALTLEIARQRAELGQAWQRLEQPIHYAEYGLRGFGFLRANPWIFAALPLAFRAFSTVYNWRKKKTAEPAPEAKPQGFIKKIFGRVLGAYKFYRGVRSNFP